MHDVALVAQAMLGSAGLNVDVEVLEFGTQPDRYVRGNYQLMVFNYTPYLDPAFGFARFVGDKSMQTDKVWDDPQASALVLRLMATPDPAARQAYFDQLHHRFVEQAPMAVWASGLVVSAWQRGVTGYAPWAGRKARLWNVALAAR
jgi:peptide/nickel transport system substrate-binding protein